MRAAKPYSQHPWFATDGQPDRRTRAQRWHDTVARLVALQAEYAAWYDVLPDNLRDTATGAALQAIVELDLDDVISLEPPRGFGRD